MFVDRPQLIQIVGDRLESQDTEFLNVYLETADIVMLSDPSRRYTMDRFMGCTDSGLSGWAIDDKVHKRLETPVRPEDRDKLAQLSLDAGGDLYFTIWDARPLRQASEHEEFLVEEGFMTADPSEKLRQLGIQAVRLHQLNKLANMLDFGY